MTRTDPTSAPLIPGTSIPAARLPGDPSPAEGRSEPGDPPARRLARSLRDRVGGDRFDRWFAQARLEVSGQRVEIAAESSFVARWIDSHLAEEVRSAASEVLGPSADVRISFDRPAVAPRSRGSAPPARPGDRDADAPRPARAPRGPALRRLEEFVVGASNRLAYAAAQRLARDPDAREISPLFVHGECGVGKTHLVQGICRAMAAQAGRPGAVRYVTGEQFTNEYIAAVRNQTLDAFRARVRRLDLLAIDDVHFLSNKVRTQSEFLHTLDSIDLTGARVVLASDEHPRLIKRFSQALVSRFLSGMVVAIDRPDRATRIAIVRQLAARRGTAISAQAIEAVAARCAGSVRELEGALTKLAALHALRPDGPGCREEIGMVAVEQLFRDAAHATPVPIRLATIIDEVGERLQASRSDLMGSSRQRRVVLARALVAFLARDLTNHSFPEIARALGRSYHSTMHTAAGRLRRQIGEDITVDVAGEPPIALRELVDQLRHRIRAATG